VPEPTLIGHNDIAPYNSCFDGDDLVGVFDWDLSGPTNPLQELAFIAWNCVPLWADIGADRAARRLTLITDTYSGFGPREVLRAVPRRIQLMIDGIVASAAVGDPGMINLVEGGEPDSDRASLADLKSRIPGIANALA
jgi:Phosphotransferase enzyme family